LKASGKQFICYFSSGAADADGKSWCPDCVKYAPIIKEHVLDKTELEVLKGIVMERNSWVGVADHPYKKHPILKVGGVPTIMLC